MKTQIKKRSKTRREKSSNSYESGNFFIVREMKTRDGNPALPIHTSLNAEETMNLTSQNTNFQFFFNFHLYILFLLCHMQIEENLGKATHKLYDRRCNLCCFLFYTIQETIKQKATGGIRQLYSVLCHASMLCRCCGNRGKI